MYILPKAYMKGMWLMKRNTCFSIRLKLVSTYLLVLLVPSLIIGWWSYQSASDELRNSLVTRAHQSA